MKLPRETTAMNETAASSMLNDKSTCFINSQPPNSIAVDLNDSDVSVDFADTEFPKRSSANFLSSFGNNSVQRSRPTAREFSDNTETDEPFATNSNTSSSSSIRIPPSPPAPSSTRVTLKPAKPKKNATSDIEKALSSLCQTMTQRINGNTTPSSSSSCNEVFGMFVGRMLDLIPDSEANRRRLAITQILHEPF